MPAKNYAAVKFRVSSGNARYNYVKLVIRASAGADGIQLGELALFRQSMDASVYYPDHNNGEGSGGSGDDEKHSPLSNPIPDSNQRCPRCSGRGRIDCSFCYGRGTVDKYVDGDAKHKGYTKQETCPKCHGQRTLECPQCHGTGRF